MSVASALTTDHKKIHQAKFTLGQEDKFYEFTKNAKNKLEYKLKDRYVAGLKDQKKKSMKNSFGIENKLSLDFIVNKYFDIEKRLALSEYKKNKDKKKIYVRQKMMKIKYHRHHHKIKHNQQFQMIILKVN
jgi:hypothetical protein